MSEIEALSQDVIDRALKAGITIATAESCTGGGIGHALTAVSGASNVFFGGVIAYANNVKHSLLDVPQSMLEQHGAVSEPVAAVMAETVRAKMGVDLAVSVTGIAGPGGGTPSKPVGLVYIGIATEKLPTLVAELRCGDIGRAAVRKQTICEALELLLRHIGEP